MRGSLQLRHLFFIHSLLEMVKLCKGIADALKTILEVQDESIPTVKYNREGMKRVSSPVEL